MKHSRETTSMDIIQATNITHTKVKIAIRNDHPFSSV